MNDERSESPRPDAPPRPAVPPPCRHWRSILLALGILLCGVVMGSAGTVIVIQRVVRHVAENPEEARERFADRMRERLDLTDAQTVQVRRIFKQRVANLIAIREEVRPRVLEQVDGLRDDVSAVLDEAQQATWRNHFQRVRKRIPLAITRPPETETENQEDRDERTPEKRPTTD